MFRSLVLSTALLLPLAAHADDEEYLLGDYGLRIDLPNDWTPLEGKWSDWSFEGEKLDRSVKLWVWGEDVQPTLEADDAEAWCAVYEDKVGDIGGKDPKIQTAERMMVAGRPTVRCELSFDFGKDLDGAMSGATFAAKGHVVHWATISSAKRSFLATQALEMLLGRAETRNPPAETPENAEVSAAGVTATLPDGWRPPMEEELTAVANRAKSLGVEDLTGCWTALKPQPASPPDVMVTCQAGMLLGVVDTFSFPDVEATIRGKLFGGTEVPPASMVENADGRVGFLYQPHLEGKTLRVGVMPYADGIARTWLLGAPGQDDAFDAAATKVMSTATYEGEHPASFGDKVSYYVTYRPTSPMVLGPAALVLLLVGGVVFLMVRGGKKNPYEDVV